MARAVALLRGRSRSPQEGMDHRLEGAHRLDGLAVHLGRMHCAALCARNAAKVTAFRTALRPQRGRIAHRDAPSAGPNAPSAAAVRRAKYSVSRAARTSKARSSPRLGSDLPNVAGDLSFRSSGGYRLLFRQESASVLVSVRLSLIYSALRWPCQRVPGRVPF